MSPPSRPALASFPMARLHVGSRSAPVEQRNKPEECIQLGSLRIAHCQTPGHSDDGVTYIVGNWPDAAPSLLWSGDALFAGSMGRAVQHAALARDRIRERILSLPRTRCSAPARPLTTVAAERDTIPSSESAQTAVPVKPVASSKPHIRFRHCTACPLAPFTTCPRRSWLPTAPCAVDAPAMSMKLDRTTFLVSGRALPGQ